MEPKITFLMQHILILKVTKFQLPRVRRLGTMVKNILGDHHAPPMSYRVKDTYFGSRTTSLHFELLPSQQNYRRYPAGFSSKEK